MQEQNFEELLNESMKEIYVDDVITGVVIAIRDDEIVLNIGYKADAVIKKADFTFDANVKLCDCVNIGDEIEAKVKKLNDGEGQVVLSRKEMLQNHINEVLKNAFESGEIQKGKVVLVNKGGLSVELEKDVKVFIPASLVSDKKNEDINSYLGQEIEFYITEFNPIRRRCIGDRKKILVENNKKMKEEALENVKEGAVYDGIIKSIVDYGVFVDIGGVDGLLHVREMGWGKIENPKKKFNVGDKIRVLVREFSNNKISLTAKFPDENPWLKAKEDFAIGKTVKGKIARMTSYGAFVALNEYIDGLLHVSQISIEKIKKPEDVLTIGQEIEAKVIDFNETEHKISLSMKALIPPKEEREMEMESEEPQDVNIEEFAKKMEEEN